MTAEPIPYAELETIFLDAGNTLVSMDYGWIAEELSRLGVEASPAALHRAEASARPVVSASISRSSSTEGESTFELYLRTMLSNLEPAPADPSRVARELVPVLRGAERNRLWSAVLPGVPAALDELAALGLRLVVVSNSDGTVEELLARAGLRERLEAVFDSHLVGYEKPDPRFFRHALEETGSAPERTLHVGDLYHADVVGARGASVHAALLDPFGDWAGVDCPRLEDLGELARAARDHRA